MFVADLMNNPFDPSVDSQMSSNEFIERLDLQTRKISMITTPLDIIKLFLNKQLKIYDLGLLEDLSIYSVIDSEKKEELIDFVEVVYTIFENNIGISLTETNIKLLYEIYNVFVLKKYDYFVDYISGLNKLDSSCESIYDPRIVKYNYYKKNIHDKNDTSEYSIIRGYIEYILYSHIYTDEYFAFALTESQGDIMLTSLLIELDNYRLSFNEPFFSEKLKRMMSTPEALDYIIDRTIQVLEIDV